MMDIDNDCECSNVCSPILVCAVDPITKKYLPVLSLLEEFGVFGI